MTDGSLFLLTWRNGLGLKKKSPSTFFPMQPRPSPWAPQPNSIPAAAPCTGHRRASLRTTQDSATTPSTAADAPYAGRGPPPLPPWLQPVASLHRTQAAAASLRRMQAAAAPSPGCRSPPSSPVTGSGQIGLQRPQISSRPHPGPRASPLLRAGSASRAVRLAAAASCPPPPPGPSPLSAPFAGVRLPAWPVPRPALLRLRVPRLLGAPVAACSTAGCRLPPASPRLCPRGRLRQRPAARSPRPYA